METSGNRWNMLETTVSYKTRARLTPTLTHVVMYKLVTSGAEDGAMSTGVNWCYGNQLLIWQVGSLVPTEDKGVPS